MNKLIIIFLIVTLSLSKGASAQGELNNNPPPQQAVNLPVGQADINLNNVADNNADQNKDQQMQSPGNDKVQKDKGGDEKEPPCKECEEIKKLKKEQQSQGSGITSGDGKTKHQYFKRFCVRAGKKWNRAFVRHKKNKPDYSCFNW